MKNLVFLLWHSDTTKHPRFKKKKKGANEREITFEKFRELQSETVAKATLYQ